MYRRRVSLLRKTLASSSPLYSLTVSLLIRGTLGKVEGGPGGPRLMLRCMLIEESTSQGKRASQTRVLQINLVHNSFVQLPSTSPQLTSTYYIPSW